MIKTLFDRLKEVKSSYLSTYSLVHKEQNEHCEDVDSFRQIQPLLTRRNAKELNSQILQTSKLSEELCSLKKEEVANSAAEQTFSILETITNEITNLLVVVTASLRFVKSINRAPSDMLVNTYKSLITAILENAKENLSSEDYRTLTE